MSEAATTSQTEVVRTLRMSSELDARVDDVVRRVGLKKSDVHRLALERGLDVLLEQLGKKQDPEAA